MTRDEALLTLSDHYGESVEVTVDVKRGDRRAPVMSANGVLRHWSAGSDTSFTRFVDAMSREDLTGLYTVGDASFDITELSHAGPLALDGEPACGLGFVLEGGAGAHRHLGGRVAQA